MFCIVFLVQVAAFDFQVNPYFFLAAVFSVFLYMIRGYLLDVGAGIWFRILQYGKKGDLEELQDKKGIIKAIGFLRMELQVTPTKVMVIPNSIFLNEFTRNYSKESEKQLAFDVNIPKNMEINEAKEALGNIIIKDLCVNRFQISDVIKSIKPGYAYNIKVKVWYFDGCYWHIVNHLHDKILASFNAGEQQSEADSGIVYFENEASGTE